MNTRQSNGVCRTPEAALRSDFLPQLAGIMDAFPSLRPLFPKLMQMRLVVDANRVQGELRWRLKRRRNPVNRSSIHEAIDAGVVVLFAPLYVKWEIENHYHDIAEETGTTVAEVEREWALFQKHLCFHAPKTQPSPTKTYADVNDFPYLATWMELDAQAIYTTDPHLSAMGAPVVSVLIDMQLRDYARASTIQVVFGIGSSFSIVVGLEFLQILYRLLTKCLKALRQLPAPLQLGMATVVVICLTNPKCRSTLKDGWHSLKQSEIFAVLGAALTEFAVQAAEAAKRSKDAYESLQAIVPAKQKRSLVIHARSVCTAAGSALTLEEIERRIYRGGYESRSRTFRQYLRRVVRADPSFIEVSPGRWRINVALSGR